MTKSCVITERGERESCLGNVLQLKVHAPNYSLLSWREIWDAFTAEYPRRWAVQCFPPKENLLDCKNVYHLWVLESEPWGLNLKPLVDNTDGEGI